MHISALRVANFRRLNDVLIDFAKDISILVGSNNSGKTSTAHVLELFVRQQDKFSIHDFNSAAWAAMNAVGDGVVDSFLPKISVDIWFGLEQQTDLHRVVDLLPRLNWRAAEVGVRIEFASNDPDGLLARFVVARTKAQTNIKLREDGTVAFHPAPKTMYEHLSTALNDEYGLRYYVLNRACFGDDYRAEENYVPNLMTPEKGRTGKQVLDSLVRIEVLNAQRHLADKAGGHRAEDLSRHLSRYYQRNLDKRDEDYDAMQALAESEKLLNVHLEKVFGPMLAKLSALGYPEHPKLLIRSALNPAAVMNATEDGAKVHYVLNPGDDEPITLPDRYNGLGFKNLIYMVVELLDRHSRWLEIQEDRPPLHLMFIEEPEVHLHAQLQQVFIRKIETILKLEGDDEASCHNQFLITTHSPHILYERGFKPIRYFRRSPETQVHQTCEVLNLSEFYNNETENRDFLERYMKLTHCDLFFADAAIMVEGNVERLLLPQMIAKEAKRLQTACLSIMEVGGAFAYRFRTLIEFLGIPSLIITDLDSVLPPAAGATATAGDAADDEDAEGDDVPVAGSACEVRTPGALTSNQTLIAWLPALTTVDALLTATPETRTQDVSATSLAHVRVAYQTACPVEWNGVTGSRTGRTLEEAFALQNLSWCQHMDQRDIKLRISANTTKQLDDLATRLFKRVNGKSFKKTDFALALLMRDPETWAVPTYISDGLKWLENVVKPEATAPIETTGDGQ